MVRRGLLPALLAAAGLCASGTGATPTPTGPCGRTSSPPPSWHVIWIVFENKSDGEVLGSPQAPYFNRLAWLCGLATNYSAVGHPSLPNYLALTSGSTWGIHDDGPPAAHPLRAASIYEQLERVGKSWREYEESAPSRCPHASSGLYAVRHDPAAYYRRIAAKCAVWDVPMGTTRSGAFVSALRRDRLPDFAFVTPNLCNDMHDCSIRTGDSWLKRWMQLILAGPAYAAGHTAVFVTFDEGSQATGKRVPLIVVSPTTPAATTSSRMFTHYSLLRTTEQMLGVPLLGLGHGATSLSAFNLG